VSPDPVVTWSDEGSAKGFIESKGGGADFQAVAVDDASMDAMAKALGCSVEQLMFEPYPS
jgi:L-alanine-DL-glutamate epimerase-like enolase superfamily enzyme